MITSNKIEIYWDRVLSPTPSPVTAELFLTEFCNNKCHYCRYGNTTGGKISLSDFKLYVNRLKSLGVRGVNLTGGGEPTVHPQFMEICQYLDSIDLPYGINTNLNIPLDFANPRWLKVSIDAISREDYQEKRGVDSLEKVISNIISFKAAHPKTNLGIQCLVENVEQATKFYERFKDLPANYIVYRPMESTKSFYGIEHARGIIEELNQLVLVDDRNKLNYKWEFLSTRFDKCYANWSVITLDINGNVLYCCQKPNEIVGHILDSDILSKKSAFKTNMSKCEVPCRLSGANTWYQQNGDRIRALQCDKEFI